MERHELIGLMRELKLAGMRAAYDDIMRAGVQHRREPAENLGDLLKAELAESEGANTTRPRERPNARSIRYQMSVARFPVTKSLAEFDFDAAAVNESLVRSLHEGDFLDKARNAVFIGDEPSRAIGSSDDGEWHGQVAPRDSHRRQRRQRPLARALLQRRRLGEPPRGRTSRGPRRTPGPPSSGTPR